MEWKTEDCGWWVIHPWSCSFSELEIEQGLLHECPILKLFFNEHVTITDSSGIQLDNELCMNFFYKLVSSVIPTDTKSRMPFDWAQAAAEEWAVKPIFTQTHLVQSKPCLSKGWCPTTDEQMEAADVWRLCSAYMKSGAPKLSSEQSNFLSKSMGSPPNLLNDFNH